MISEQGDNTALALADELYKNRTKRVLQLKTQGKKVVGYFCIYVPLEMMHAAGIIPYRIWGTMREPPSIVNNYFVETACFYARTCFELALKGTYDFLDGIVGSFTCDTFESMFQVWRYNIKLPYYHVVMVPHAIHAEPPLTSEFFKKELEYFKKSLEDFSGKEITSQSLSDSVKLFNTQRALVRELHSLRKEDPPLISGTEAAKALIATMCLPVEESNELLRGVIKEAEERKLSPQGKATRALIWGTPLDDIAVTQLVEENGANVVVEDTCTGIRPHLFDVEVTADPLDGIVNHYTEELTCPTLCKEISGTHKEDVENRYGYLKELVKDYKVNAVIMPLVTYCCNHAIDSLNIRDYLKEETGIPSLMFEHDYNVAALAPIKTRVQAFVEMIRDRAALEERQ